MPLIQEVSGLGVAVPEMECNSMVEDRGIFNPGVHRSLIELVKAEDVGYQPLHGLVPYAGVVALILRAGAVPRPCRGAVLALSGLAAVIGTAAAAFYESGELVEGIPVRIGILALVPFSPELSALVCPPVGLGSRLPFGGDLVAVVKAEGQGIVSDNDDFLDLLTENVLVKLIKAQHLRCGILEHLLRDVLRGASRHTFLAFRLTDPDVVNLTGGIPFSTVAIVFSAAATGDLRGESR